MLKTKKKITRFVALALVLVTLIATPAFQASPIVAQAADASTLITKEVAQSKLNTLVSSLQGKYFTTTGKAVYSDKCKECYNVNVIGSTWLKKATNFVPNSYNLMPEHYSSKSGYITNNAWSCAGAANYFLWYIYATNRSDNIKRVNVYTGKFNKSNLDNAKLWPGDVMRFNGHSSVYISHNSSGVRVLDSNWNHDNKIQVHTIPYTWGKNTQMACTRGKNYTTKIDTNAYYYLDLNCYLDGSYRGDINGIATADVYINGRKVAENVTDYYVRVKYGTSYTIKDIRTKSGYTYNGKSSYSGKVTGTTNVNLSFSKNVTSYSANFRMKSGAYTNAYSSHKLTSKVGRIYKNDIITVKRIYSNGVAQIVCPWTNNTTKTVYAKINEIKFTATKYINAYNSVNGNKIGRAYPKDVLELIAIYNNNGVIWCKASCPWNNSGNRIIYLKASEIY